MKDSDKPDFEALLQLAAAGQLTRRDCVALFMYPRRDARRLGDRASMVLDIGDSIAHDVRNQGGVHGHINEFVDNWVRFFESNVMISGRRGDPRPDVAEVAT